MTRRSMVAVGAIVASCGMAQASDISQANGVMFNNRVWNDFPGSTLTPVNTWPTAVGWNEQFAVGEVGNFANKHLAYLSTDGGTSAHQHHVAQGFTLSFTVNISAPNALPRKEGALQIENPRPALGFTDEGHMLVASDGEVAIFGGAMPFFSSNVPGSWGSGSSGSSGGWYTLGQTAQVSFTYYAPGDVDPTLGAYRITFNDPVTGMHDSGLKIWGVESDGTAGFNTGTKIAFQAQNTRNPLIADSSDVIYGNVSVVPAPGALALLGLGGLAAARRRR